MAFKRKYKDLMEKAKTRKVKLPFVATGWKSTKNPVIIKDNEAVATIVDVKEKEEVND